MAFFGLTRKLSSEISPVTLNRPELAHCTRFKGEALMRCQTRKPRPLHGELNPRGIKFRPQTALSIPDLERFLAKRMKATTIELDSSHVSMVSHPKEIADLILLAAGREKSR